jgi:cytochrome c553
LKKIYFMPNPSVLCTVLVYVIVFKNPKLSFCMKKLILMLSVVSFSLFVSSCKKDEAAPAVVVVPKVTFAKVAPILKTNCAPCHEVNGGANFEARKKFVENFSISKEFANGIADRIQRETTAAGFMPRGKAKLSDADIGTIKQWIADGLLEK